MSIPRDAARDGRTDSPQAKGWVIRIPVDAIERTNGLSPRAFRLLIVLESYCRDHIYCWPTTRAIASQLGCTPRQATNCLVELESAGWAERGWMERGRNYVRIIRLIQRLDPTMPVRPSEWDVI